MKRRKFLIALGVLPPLVLSACKGDKLPKTATIIKITITDDKGIPFENVSFRFYGYRTFGGSIAGGGSKEDTFRIEKLSDKLGKVEFSQVVPENTTQIYLLITRTVGINIDKYIIQSQKGGVNVGEGTTKIGIYPGSLTLGETNEYKVTLTKK